jgi:uncharacterized protein YeaO (DUF488 family)
MIVTKRIYDPPSSQDGHRVLVDRLWPRGLTREKAAIEEWAKDIAPSNELHRWFGADAKKWAEFERRYRAELSTPEARAELAHLRKLAKSGTLTLLYAKRDQERNNATVLKEVLDEEQ